MPEKATLNCSPWAQVPSLDWLQLDVPEHTISWVPDSVPEYCAGPRTVVKLGNEAYGCLNRWVFKCVHWGGEGGRRYTVRERWV